MRVPWRSLLDAPLAQLVIEQRDALLAGPSAKSHECPICMVPYRDDEEGKLVPRIITLCGHTACHGCIADMLTRVNAVGSSKPYPCPICKRVTKVLQGKASELAKNYALM